MGLPGGAKVLKLPAKHFLLLVLCAVFPVQGLAQTAPLQDGEFGPVVSAYLKYLKSEQDVVDDRISRHEVSSSYYRRNSNRIHALRAMAVRIARETGNDYLPELEAATRDELRTLFEHPPAARDFRVGEVLNNTFRFLGVVRNRETFFLFARLDPYEQADLLKMKADRQQAITGESPSQTSSQGLDEVRPRRVKSP
jgi:hypothetical protein